MEISNLPSDLLEEILAKLPLTSPRNIRLTCKTWYTLSTTQSFAKKHINEAVKSESKLFIMLYSKIYLLCLNLQNIHNNHVEPSIERLGKFSRSRGYDISQILHCDGLLLCIQNYNDGLVVWNPYLVQKRWIEYRTGYHAFDVFAIGYKEKHDKSRSYKILKYMYGYGYEPDGSKVTSAYEIYDLESGSWKLFNMTRPYWIIERDGQHCVSLKGNTFWVAQEERKIGSKREHVLLCFDFTRERFGPSLRFPFQSYVEVYNKDCYIALSSVREEQLVVSIQKMDRLQNTLEMEIWVTSEITPETVLWSKLLAVDMRPFADYPFCFPHTGGSFFIDEEKKVAVFVSENHWAESCIEATIIGVRMLGTSKCRKSWF